MEQTPIQLIYWDKHRIPVNLTLIFSLAVAAFGVFDQEWLLIVAGLGVGAYSWFTNPRRYLIYPDSLNLVYGMPRVRVIPFTNISRLEMQSLATPDRLRVWLTSGRRVVLLARDPDAFHDKLQEALDEFARNHPEYAQPQDAPDDPPETPEPPSDNTTTENRPPDFT